MFLEGGGWGAVREELEGAFDLLGNVRFFVCLFDTSADSSKRGLVASGYWGISSPGVWTGRRF